MPDAPKAADTSKLVCFVVDNGNCCEIAVRLAPFFKRMLYFSGTYHDFPEIKTHMLGYGLEGIEIAEDFWRAVDKADLIIYPDVYGGGDQRQLVKMGKAVWGSRYGEDLEIYRDGLRVAMKKAKLPVAPYAVVKGVKALRQYCAGVKKKWIKPIKWRGVEESFQMKDDLASIDEVLKRIEFEQGPLAEIIEFIVEDDLPDKVELAIEAWNIDGQWPKIVLGGTEVKNQAYVSVWRPLADFPEPLTRFNAAMAPEFKRLNYRGFACTEVRIGRDKVPYLVDFTARAPMPPTPIIMSNVKNIAEVFNEGANGRCVDPIPVKKFAAEVACASTWAPRFWLDVTFPKEFRDRIYLSYAVKMNGRYSISPREEGGTEIISVVGLGDTARGAVEDAKRIAKEVRGHRLHPCDDALDEAMGNIEEARAMGLNMFS
jgi:hypothetical protein